MSQSFIFSASLSEDVYKTLYNEYERRKKEYRNSNPGKKYTWDMFFREDLKMNIKPY